MAKFPESAQMERRGVNYIALKCNELGHIWRETQNSDVGFDGEIELVTGGSATGQIIKVQIRAGTSYLRNEKSDRFDFYGDANELEYWSAANNPVLLIVFDPRNDSAFWLDVKNYIRIHPEVTQRPHKITFIKEQRLKPLSTEALESLFGPNYEELTNRYLHHVIERFSKLTIYSINSDSPLAVDLERVFIKLRASRPNVLLEAWQRSKQYSSHQSVDSTALIKAALTLRRQSTLRPRSILRRQLAEALISYSGEHSPSATGPSLGEPISIGEALSGGLNTVVIGAPGSGKTTLLRYLALTFARRRMEEQLGITEAFLPLLITLRDFSRFLDNTAQRGELLELGPKLLPDYITTHVDSIAPNLKIPQEFFLHHLDSAKCILLFDGLDEVADPLKRVRVAEAIDAFTRHFKGNRFVVTSRPRGYEGEARQRLSPLYSDWLIQDFDNDDMENFTTSWYEAVTCDRLGDSQEAVAEARQKAADLLRAIKEDRRVQALAHNPLLLSVLAMVHQRGVGLPQRRAELYDECTDFLLGYWDQTKGGEAARELAQYGELDKNEKRTLLEPISLWFHERGQQGLEADKEELQQKIAEQFRETFVDNDRTAQKRAELFLRVIDERAGLLVEREVNVYSFAHLTFQEYLAARAIADSDDYIEYTLKRMHDDWWKEVILLQIGHLSDVRHFGRRGRKLTTELITRIRGAGSFLEPVLRRDLFFVAKALADIGPLGVDDEIRQDVFKDLIELWLSTPFELQRREVASILGYALPTSEGQRIRALIVSLLDQSDPHEVVRVIKAIAQFGEPLIDNDLANRLFELTYHDSASVRSTAVLCIEKLSTATRAHVITKRILELTEDLDAVVRLAAGSRLLSLGKVGMRSEIIDCLFRLITDEDRSVRDVAVISLARISQTRSKRRIEDRLIGLAEDAEPEIRASGAVAVGEIAKIRPTADLVKRLLGLTSDTDEGVRKVAFDMFDEIANSSARKDLIDRLFQHLGHQDKVTTNSAETILRKLRLKEFVPSVNPESQVSGGASLKTSVPLEQRFLEFSIDPDPTIRLSGLDLLDRSHSASSYYWADFVRKVKGSVTDESRALITARSSSTKLQKQVEARLVELLFDPDTTVKLRSARSYRQRLKLPYERTSIDILLEFWMQQLSITEEISWDDNYSKVCDIGYEELKQVAQILQTASTASGK